MTTAPATAREAGPELETLLALLHDPRGILEVRALGLDGHQKKTASGCFDAPADAGRAVRSLTSRGRARHLYATLNPVDPRLLARAAGRMLEWPKQTTKDSDIAARRWLLLDLDPDRPSGIPSSAEEHAAARRAQETLRDRLWADGWPEPVEIDSGNGAYLLYRVDLPNDDAAKDLIRRVLLGLAELVETPGVELDATVYNAAQLLRLPGTWNRKGTGDATRPHRLCRLVRAPAEPAPVSRAMLEAVAAAAETSPASGPPKSRGGRPLDERREAIDGIEALERWLQTHTPHAVREAQPFNGTGVLWRLDPCPLCGQSGKASVGKKGDGAIWAICHRKSCGLKSWRDLREWAGDRPAGGARPSGDGFTMPTGPAFAASRDLGLTDAHNADRLLCRHGQDLLYCHPHKRWYVWSGAHWKQDTDGELERRAAQTVHLIYDEARHARRVEPDRKRAQEKYEALRGFARRSLRARAIPDMLSHTRSRVSAAPTSFDRDPWLMTVVNGTLDLRKGALRSHRREDRNTKIAPVVFDPDARAPRWRRFLREVFGEDGDLIEYVQRVAGYCLTGDTSEQKLWFLHGLGANGKSTLLDVLRRLVGDYGSHAAIETFLRRDQDTTRNDLAALQGARLVTAAETEEGRAIDESMVKTLTGGDPVRCRFLYGEYFEYEPSFKILIATNHRPVVRGQDAGIWRRLHLIPFEQSFEGRADPRLLDELRAELPGILAWAVQGCLAWQEAGLAAPKSVSGATTAYRSDMDELQGFFDECCVFIDTATTSSKDLYRAYKAWCERAGERPRSMRRLGSMLGERLLRKLHTKRGNAWRGIALVAACRQQEQ